MSTPAEQLSALPYVLTGWEIGFIADDDPESRSEGLLLVADPRDGGVRAFGRLLRGRPLWAALGGAFTDPVSGAEPSRPSHLACADPALAARLRDELSGLDLRVELVPEVPAADAALRALGRAAERRLAAAGEREGAPSLEPERWDAALTALYARAPWTDPALTDVPLRLTGAPELDGHVVTVFGVDDADGLIVHRSFADFERSVHLAELGEPQDDAAKLCLLLRPPRLPRPDAPLGGHAPKISSYDGRFSAPDAAHERALLAAVEAATAALCGHPAPGPVTATPARRHLIDAPHRLRTGRVKRDGLELPTVLLQLYKPDARRLAPLFAALDLVTLDLAGEVAVLEAWQDGAWIGSLGALRPSPAFVIAAQAAPVLQLELSAGGPNQLFDEKNVLGSYAVRLRVTS